MREMKWRCCAGNWTRGPRAEGRTRRNLKLDHIRQRSEPAPVAAAPVPSVDEEELNELRAKLAEAEEEIERLKSEAAEKSEAPAPDTSSQEELSALQKQIAQYRDEASIAQRGLALSQKALQETRDALREASEGSSAARKSLEGLKNELAAMVQQNMALQAQHDQMSRDLTAAKGKAGR
jgi:chromosome segregation ATPase